MCQDHDSGGSWVLKTCRFLFLVSMLAKKTRLTKIGPITMKKTSLHEMEFDSMFEILQLNIQTPFFENCDDVIKRNRSAACITASQ